MQAPSTAATPCIFPLVQDENLILNGRPFKTRALPVYLYHDAFSTFTGTYDNKFSKVPLDIQEIVYDLCFKSAALYETKSERLRHVIPTFRLLLKDSMQAIKINGSDADAAITILSKEGSLPLAALFEWENDIGSGSCGPNLHGCCSSVKFWSDDTVRLV